MYLDVVGAVETECRTGPRFIAEQEAARIDRDVKPLMRIEGNRICALEAAKSSPLGFIERGQCAIGAINVEPGLNSVATSAIWSSGSTAPVFSAGAADYAKMVSIQFQDRPQSPVAMRSRSGESDHRKEPGEPARPRPRISAAFGIDM